MNLDLEKMELISKWTEEVVRTIEIVKRDGVEPCGLDMNQKTFEVLKNSFTITPAGYFTWFGLDVMVVKALGYGEIFVWGE